MTTLTSADHEVVRQLTEDVWTAGIMARDWKKVLAVCAEDVVYMPPDHPILLGQAALHAWLDQFPRVLDMRQPLETVEGQGTLAMSRASFSAAVDIGGQRVENTGKVLCAWRKDASGRWLVQAVCWNWNRPVSGGE